MNKNILTLIVFLFIGLSSLAQDKEMIKIHKDLQLIRIADSVYVHVSWHHLDGFGRFPSNGLILMKNSEALLIDTPMNNAKTETLYNYLKDSMSVRITQLIIGHFHDDCLGGLGYLKQMKVKSIANDLSIEKCKQLQKEIPDTGFKDSLYFSFNGEPVECRFFGAGHSFDNITVWFPNEKILFGGCLIKSLQSRGLGNLSDAVVEDWDTTVEKLQATYPNVKIVVPGHGKYGDRQLLQHTIDLVKEKKESASKLF